MSKIAVFFIEDYAGNTAGTTREYCRNVAADLVATKKARYATPVVEPAAPVVEPAAPGKKTAVKPTNKS